MQAELPLGTLVGLPWPEAECMLTAAGIPFRVVETAPPRRPQGLGERRVVGERLAAGGDRVVILAFTAFVPDGISRSL